MIRVAVLSSRGLGAGPGRPACGADGSTEVVSTMLAVFLSQLFFIAEQTDSSYRKHRHCRTAPNEIVFL